MNKKILKTIIIAATFCGIGLFSSTSMASDDVDDITMDVVDSNGGTENISQKIKLPPLKDGQKPKLTKEQKEKIQQARKKRLLKLKNRKKVLRKIIQQRRAQQAAE